MKFIPFDKIPRMNRDIVVTEKIDGTNASILIEDATMIEDESLITEVVDGWALLAGSRNRFITPTDDNYGFAAWVKENAADLVQLGSGQHFGEWWGSGIQRRYGLDHRRFSLFNVKRWYDFENSTQLAPDCCDVVPTMYMGPFSQEAINRCVEDLKNNGSYAALGYSDPEGVIVYHTAAYQLFKITCKNDEKPKGQA